MNRRNFLKYLSSIPLIGIPVKVLAKKKCGTTSITPLPDYLVIPDDETKPVIPVFKDPYADVKHIPWDYPEIIHSWEMNAAWMKRKP